MTVTYTIGDTRDVIATIPDGSISLIATSPPFIALRSYLPADHPDKHAEIGSEPDPATFIDTLLELTAEWGRVLAPWGSIAIELGDTYSGGCAQGTDQRGSDRYPNGRGQADLMGTHNKSEGEWPRAKCLALVPQAYALSLAYGRNVLTGQPSPAGQWLVRNVITWHRPNPAVGALGDKYRPSTSQIVVATRSARRWFDLTAVRQAPANGLQPGQPVGNGLFRGHPDEAGSNTRPNCVSHAAGAPPLDAWFDEYDGTNDTWTLTTQPSKLAHYAMWPAKLAERLILSMCPAEVCTQCGEPRRRVEVRDPDVVALNNKARGGRTKDGRGDGADYDGYGGFTAAATTTLGWTDCGCGAPFTPGTVLDPFCGTGSTLAVADLHGRDAIGIDIDARNQALYPARRAECARNLFDSPMPDANQLDLFGGVA
jgi:site-specific DNA-methyltransferase (adenine-specific)